MTLAPASHKPEAQAREIEAADPADLSAAELIEQLTEQFARGVTVDLDAFLQEHSQHADRLRPLLPALRTLAQINGSGVGLPHPQARSASEGAIQARSASEGTGDRGQESNEQFPAWNFEPGTLNCRLGDFRILRLIARGGMGIVYEAEQLSLHRRVALKVLPLAATLDERSLTRFRNEAHAAAGLAHPHIVPIYGLHCERGVHFYSMQFIDGLSLDRVIAHTSPKRERGDGNQGTGENRENRAEQLTDGSKDSKVPVETSESNSWLPLLPSVPSDASSLPSLPYVPCPPVPPPPHRYRWVAELGIQAAQALQYAHDRGIIHRDIKPGNLLLDQDGKLWITDFGLARIEGDANLTLTGDFLGTLRYMSPEQALGSRTSIDHRSDIYSLGATLYELLTGMPVVGGHERSDLLRKIAITDPRPPRKLDRSIPADLETILLKTLTKEPPDRYSSAKELADDLQRFLDHAPIRARPHTLGQKARSWSRRHSGFMLAATITLAAIVLAISLATAAALRAEGRTRAALNESSMNLELAHDREGEMRLALYAADIPAVQRAWQTGDLNLVRTLLQRHIPANPEQADHRGFEWHYFWRLCHNTPIIVQAHERPICALAISGDGRHLATGDDHGHVKLWRIPSFESRGELTNHDDGVRGLFFVNQGRELISVGAEGQVWRWNVDTQRRLNPPIDHPCPISAAAQSHDGTLLATAGTDRRVRVWPLAGTQPSCASEEIPAHITRLTFGPEPKTIYTATKDGRIYAIDAVSGQRVSQTSPQGEMSDLFVAAQRNRAPALVSCYLNSTTRHYDLPKLYHRGYEVMHNGRVLAGAPVPGQLAFVTGGDDGYLKFWELFGGERAIQLRRAHPHFHTPVCSAHISRDSRWLVAGGADGRFFATDAILGGEQLRVLNARMAERPSGNSLSTDGQLWVSTGTTGVAQLWKTSSGDELASLTVKLGPSTYWTAITPDRARLAIGRGDGGVEFWDISDPTHPQFLSAPSELKAARHHGEFSGDGSLLALAFPTFVGIWDTAAQQLVSRLEMEEPFGVTFSPSGSHLIASSLQGDLRIWETASCRRVAHSPSRGQRADCLKVSPDGQTLAVGDNAGIVLYALPQLSPKAQLRAPNWTTCAFSFSPDGRTLASGSGTQEVHLWNLQTYNEVARFHLIGHISQTVHFSPDGQSLVAIGYPGQISTFSIEPQR